jgi:pyridoxal phosphate enzyme (YggS family)
MTPVGTPQAITARIHAVQQELPPSVTLIAVTKFFPAEVVRLAYDAGIRHFGESRVQEAIQKQEELTDLPDITWHLIGHLQTNKVRKAVEHFQWIHSVDSLKIAQKIDQAAADLSVTPRCCLQVKMVPDPPKYGFDAGNLEQILPDLDQLTHIKIRGLMTIPPLNTPEPDVKRIFAEAAALVNHINQQSLNNVVIDQLSMGMSGDYESAIAAGATMIRLGTSLFGPRPQRA